MMLTTNFLACRRRWPLLLTALLLGGCTGDGPLPSAPVLPEQDALANSVNVAPTALFTVSPRWPRPGDTVTVDASYSLDRDGSVVAYEWSLGNGSTQVSGPRARTVFSRAGTYPVSVTVVDDSGSRSTRALSLTVSSSGAPATAVDSAQSLVLAASTSLLASATTLVTVTARNALGLPVPNVPVWLSGTGREWRAVQPSSVTSALGVATGTVSSPVTQSAQLVAIADYTLLRPVALTIGATTLSPTRSTVRLTDPTVAAAGDSTLLEVTARDTVGNPLVGALVTVSVSGGTSTVRNEGVTDANGRRVVTIEPTTCGGVPLTVTASVNGTALPTTATVTASAPAAYGVCGPALWLDADAAGTITQSGGTLTAWADRSGSGHHATASTGPTVITAGLNGRTVLRFNGINQFVSITDVVSNRAHTVFVVERRRSATGSNYMLGGTSGCCLDTYFMGYRTNQQTTWVQAYAQSSGAAVPFNGEATEPARVWGGRIFSNRQRALQINHATVFTDTILTFNRSWTGPAIGRYVDGHFNGDIGEVLIYDRPLTDDERTLVTSALMLKWRLGTLTVTAGNNQTADPRTTLPVNPQVRITDGAGNGISGATVSWQVTAGGGAVAAATSTTDANGYASTSWTLGSSGTNTLTAWYGASVGMGASVTVNATASGACPVGMLLCPVSLWLDASTAGSLETSGTTVIRWNDLSERSRHALPLGAGSAPSVHTATINGRTAVAFAPATTLESMNALDELASSAEIFLVARSTGGNSGTVFNARGNGGGRMLVHLPWTDSNVYWDYGNCCSTDARLTAQIPNMSAAVWSFTVSPTASPQRQIRRNGAALVTGNGSQNYNAPTRDLRIGSSWAGEIGELVIVPRTLANTERLALERALMAKWGIGALAISVGNMQTVASGSSPTTAPTVRLTDATGTGIANSPVTWHVTTGSGRFGASASTFSTITDANGFARVPISGGNAYTVGVGNNRLTAWLSGTVGEGQSVAFTLTGT